MAGNPSNVVLWTEADVLLYNAATLPAGDLPTDITTAFVTTTGKWGYLGLLVGAEGIKIAREWDETDIPAWGYGTIIVASKDFKCTGTVSAREDNPVVTSVLWPGSTATTLTVPTPSHQYVAIEKRGSNGEKHRMISKRPVRLWSPNYDKTEGDNTPYEINMRIFPNAARELFLVQSSALLPG